VKFTSSRYKQLVIHDLGVTFTDGEAEVSDKTTIEALRELPAELGVRATGGRPPKDPAQS
jgi:pyruvate/2-oxoglutarate dehydrogenase complex dihydrolipoamide dehydrogenase (E3) component